MKLTKSVLMVGEKESLTWTMQDASGKAPQGKIKVVLLQAQRIGASDVPLLSNVDVQGSGGSFRLDLLSTKPVAGA